MTDIPSDLVSQHCSQLADTDSTLSGDETSVLLQQLNPLWQLNQPQKTISYSYVFNNYYRR